MTATITASRHPQYGTARKIKTRPKTSDKPATDRRCALRVKIKSLAAEAAIIRREEQRTRNYGQFLFLHDHRVREVRRHAREAQLALAYIRGKTYASVEQPKRGNELNLIAMGNIAKMVSSYGPVSIAGRHVAEWIGEPA